MKSIFGSRLFRAFRFRFLFARGSNSKAVLPSFTTRNALNRPVFLGNEFLEQIGLAVGEQFLHLLAVDRPAAK